MNNENNLSAFIDLSNILDDFIKQAHLMNFAQLIEASATVQNFTTKYCDHNLEVYSKSVKVLLMLFKEMSRLFRIDSY